MKSDNVCWIFLILHQTVQICIFRSSWDWPRESNLHKSWCWLRVSAPHHQEEEQGRPPRKVQRSIMRLSLIFTETMEWVELIIKHYHSQLNLLWSHLTPQHSPPSHTSHSFLTNSVNISFLPVQPYRAVRRRLSMRIFRIYSGWVNFCVCGLSVFKYLWLSPRCDLGTFIKSQHYSVTHSGHNNDLTIG